MSNDMLQMRLRSMYDQSMALNGDATKLVKGRRVRIMSDWKGEKRRSQRGKVYEVRGAFSQEGWGMYLWVVGNRHSIPVGEVEFLAEDYVPTEKELTRFDLIDEE